MSPHLGGEARTMIEIVSIDHFGQAVAELKPQAEFLERVLGLRRSATFERPGFRGMTLAIPGSSRMGWELLAPDGPESYLHRFLDGVRGPGLHHVAIGVSSVEATREAIRASGYEPHEDGDSHVTYLHPARGGQGFLYQFFDQHDPQSWYGVEPFEDDGEHTLGIIAVNHIAHAHPVLDELGDWYETMLGFQTFLQEGSNKTPGTEFETRVLDAPTKQMRVEVISPTHPDSFIQRFLDQRGPAVHHLTIEVSDWDRAVAALEHHDVRTLGERSSNTGRAQWREAFIHPKETGGVLLQFFWQVEPGVWI
jgi:methylmalonyl-CoA epimerase